MLEGKWDTLCTKKPAERIQSDIKQIMKMIWKKLGKKDGLLFDIGPQTTWTGEVKE